MEVIQDIKLNINDTGQYTVVTVKQADSGRILNVTMVDDNTEIAIPSTATASVRVLKEDGTSVDDACTISDGKIVVELTDQITAVAGYARADVSVASGGKIVSTATFLLKVGAVPMGVEIVSENEFTQLSALIASASQYETRIGNLEEQITDLKEDLNNIDSEIFVRETVDGDEQAFTSEYADQVLAMNGWTATLAGWYVSTAIPIPYGATHIKADYTTDFENTSQTRCAVDFFLTSSVGTSIVGYYRDVTNGEYLEIPEGASYVRFSYQDATTEHFCFASFESTSVIGEMQSDISTIEDGLSQIAESESYSEISEEYITPNWSTGYCEPTNGRIYTGANYDNFIYSQKITVGEGDIIHLWNNETDAFTLMRSITAYNGDSLVASAGVGTDSQSYTVPAGVNGIIITRSNNGYTYTIYRTSDTESTLYHIIEKPLGYMRATGNLADEQTLKLLEHNVKHDNVTVFTARITSFSSIKIGKNIGATPYAVIDDTNITFTNSSQTITVAHGLTIADDIQVIIETTQNNNRLKRFVVSSQGNDFVYTTDIGWLDDQGEAYVTSIGSTLTGCVLSWTCRHINKPIWLFGDSYFSFAVNRWAYYLIQDGYIDSCMLNGFSGEASTKAYLALTNLLTTTTPKYVVWCIGMNNGDSASAVNAIWKEYYDRVVNLSKKHGFELILYTTPTTPDVNNNFKNAIVRASGYRYVDADGALKVDDDGNWISGTLYTDNVHPTAQGAKVIYHQFLTDLPELTSK